MAWVFPNGMNAIELCVLLSKLPASAKILIPSGGDAPPDRGNSDGLAPVCQLLLYGEGTYVLSADPVDHY